MVVDAAWCVCRSDQSSTSLQKTLDYACGAGADCSPIQQTGACYNPNTVLAHCSYAANSYFQRKGQTQQACDFAGTATLSASDPSKSPANNFPPITWTPTNIQENHPYFYQLLTLILWLVGSAGCTYPASSRYIFSDL